MNPNYDDIPRMLAAGMLGKQIAIDLNVDKSTVCRHAKRLGVSVRRHRRGPILTALTNGPRTTAEIVSITGIKMRVVSTLLCQMAKQGVVERCGQANRDNRGGRIYLWRLCHEVGL